VALINAAGFVHADVFATIDDERMREMFEVNVLAPAKFIRAFLQDIRAERAIGVLNVVSSTGRVGSPILSGYAASNSALWTLSESIDRELLDQDISVTTYVASAMHSRMQKRIGRVALRYFGTGGEFDYEHADVTAQRSVDALLARKHFVIGGRNRMKVLVNDLFPGFVNRKIASLWRP
jgi:short-subunit dehydrogenase